MHINRYLMAIMAAGLVACGTVSETQSTAPAPEPQAETPAPVVAAEPAPAPEPTPVAEVAPAPAPAAVAPAPKRVVKKKARPVAAVPVAAVAAAPTEQEIAAALAWVDETLGRYMVEQLRFTAPASIKRDATGAAGLEFGSAAAFDKAREVIAGNEQVRKAGIQVSSRVLGRLAGESIDVKAGSPETQELSGALPGKWNWQLLPTTEGRAKVHLVVSVDTTVGGSTAPRSIYTMDKEILVEGVAPAPEQGGFFSANWWWILIVALLASVGAWVMRRRAE